MDILVAIIFTFLLNIPVLILIIMGVVLVNDKKPLGKISLKQINTIGIILIVLGILWGMHGFFTGYGLQ